MENNRNSDASRRKHEKSHGSYKILYHPGDMFERDILTSLNDPWPPAWTPGCRWLGLQCDLCGSGGDDGRLPFFHGGLRLWHKKNTALVPCKSSMIPWLYVTNYQRVIQIHIPRFCRFDPSQSPDNSMNFYEIPLTKSLSYPMNFRLSRITLW